MNDDTRSPDDHEPALIPEVLERADVESGAYAGANGDEPWQSGPTYTVGESRFRIWTCSPGCILFALLLCAFIGVAIIWIV